MSKYSVFWSQRFKQSYHSLIEIGELKRLEEIVSALESMLETHPDRGTFVKQRDDISIFRLKPYDVLSKMTITSFGLLTVRKCC